jgi:hypothetical protein
MATSIPIEAGSFSKINEEKNGNRMIPRISATSGYVFASGN